MLQMPATGYPYSVNGGFALPVNTVWEVIDNKNGSVPVLQVSKSGKMF